MKTKLLIPLLMAAGIASAAETNTTATAKWIDSITVAPVGVIKTADLDGKSQWGAGLDLGVGINPFVSIHVLALTFEGEGKSTTMKKTKEGYNPVTTGEDDWGGRFVDEIDIFVKAKLSTFSTESFSLFATGGGQYDLNLDDWGVGVGLGAELAFNKTVSISGGYTIRSWFKKPTHVDSLASAQFNLRF